MAFERNSSRTADSIFSVVLIGTTLWVTFSHLFFSPAHPLHINIFHVSVLGKFLTFALLALAVDLVWGYLGILTLGHGAFFALGGYVMGMYLMRQIGDRGVYGHPELADFMVFLNWQELPWFWWGFEHFGFTVVMVIAVPAVLAFVFGWFAFRSRVNGVYLSIMTQAMTLALMYAFLRNEMGFGGNNGLTDFKEVLGFSLRDDTTRLGLFIASALALLVGYALCRIVVNSKSGQVARAIRDAESRTRFIGYDVEHYKLGLFTLSAILAGVAGALYVPQVGIINPNLFSPLNSILIVVWVALGGRGTLYGAVIGALVVNYTQSWLTVAMPELWVFLLGALFVVVTVWMPRGMVGWIPRREV